MSLLVLMGKSCSGKDTIANELVNKHGYENLVPYTTRPMRDDEIQDKTYHFISEDECIDKINDGFFLEYRKYFSASGLWYYGTAKEDYEKDSKMILILPPDGVNALISKGINPKVIYIYANQITIKNRLLKRGDNKDEADRRLKSDNVDFRGAEMLANRIIYNNEGKELSDVVNEVLKWGD
mgnify:CR=1 FL=1